MADDRHAATRREEGRRRASCPPSSSRRQVNVPLMHQVVVAGLAAHPRRHAHDEDARRGPRRRQEAVAPEGHRPRPAGLDPVPPVGRRRRRPRPSPATTTQRINKKMRRGALRSALTDALQSGKLAVVDELDFEEPQDEARRSSVLDALELDGPDPAGPAGRRRSRRRREVVPQPADVQIATPASSTYDVLGGPGGVHRRRSMPAGRVLAVVTDRGEARGRSRGTAEPRRPDETEGGGGVKSPRAT